jgi:hypothetical protein
MIKMDTDMSIMAYGISKYGLEAWDFVFQRSQDNRERTCVACGVHVEYLCNYVRV